MREDTLTRVSFIFDLCEGGDSSSSVTSWLGKPRLGSIGIVVHLNRWCRLDGEGVVLVGRLAGLGG